MARPFLIETMIPFWGASVCYTPESGSKELFEAKDKEFTECQARYNQARPNGFPGWGLKLGVGLRGLGLRFCRKFGLCRSPLCCAT